MSKDGVILDVPIGDESSLGLELER
jgi:hypothetical protein